MERSAHATVAAGVVIFGFDADPATPPARALQVLTVRRALPRADLGSRERLLEAAARAAESAGATLPAGRRAPGGRQFLLVAVDDENARGSHRLTVWYYATTTRAAVAAPGRWSATGRGLRLSTDDATALRRAMERLRSDARNVAGAAALLGDVFTGDDLLRVHTALHGGPEGSDRTFRRRIQELRDGGVLRPVAEREVAGLRARVPRFRSAAGTGGRPPELFRYGGNGLADRGQLVSLRARRVS